MTAAEPQPVDGVVDPGLAAELPGLRVRWVVVDGVPRRTPRDVRARLDALASRLRGAEAVALRQRPVPHAYRVFFRHVGLDPDVERTPVDAVVLARLLDGGFGTGNAIDDAVTLAVGQTGVAVVAFDDAALHGPLGVRAAGAGESLARGGGHADALAPGTLVLADEEGPVAQLFGRVSADHAPSRRTRRARLVAVAVPGVPEPDVDEALWLAASALTA